jgi:hypothetical protein
VSMMRSGYGDGQLFSLARSRLHRRYLSNEIGLSILVFTAASVWVLIQTTSIILVNDIELGPVPGKPQSINLAVGFEYNNNTPQYAKDPSLLSTSTWLQKPPFYPTFAEYSESPYFSDGIVDTGLTLRAFLPFDTAEARQTIQSYKGRTTVLDARVTCQVPELESTTLARENNGCAIDLIGSVRATRWTPRLGNYTMYLDSNGHTVHYNESVPFLCQALSCWDGYGQSQWITTLCQLGEIPDSAEVSGGLISEFKGLNSLANLENLTSDNAWAVNSLSFGTAYLVLNVTRADVFFDPIGRILDYTQQNEWQNVQCNNGTMNLSVTLCYSAFDTADLVVSISSTQGRKEPGRVLNFETGAYTFESVREQLGQPWESGFMIDLEGRGVLQLENRQSWLAMPNEVSLLEPFMRDYAHLEGPTLDGNKPNQTAALFVTGNFSENLSRPDPVHIFLFREIVKTGGSVAFALQSLITILAGMAYYEQLGEFDNNNTVETGYYVAANSLQRYWGFLALSLVLSIHFTLVVIVVTIFTRMCHSSILGNSWHAMAQVTSGEAKEYLDVASAMTDCEVENEIKTNGKEKILVGIKQSSMSLPHADEDHSSDSSFRKGAISIRKLQQDSSSP